MDLLEAGFNSFCRLLAGFSSYNLCVRYLTSTSLFHVLVKAVQVPSLALWFPASALTGMLCLQPFSPQPSVS